MQLRRREAIARGKERDVVAARGQFVDQQLHEQFDAAVGGGWNARPQGSDLGNAKVFHP